MLKHLVGLVLFGCSIVIPSASNADTVVFREKIVESAPTAPPMRLVERVVERPGFVWSRGFHYWTGRRWVWRPGHFETVVVGRVWYAPRYVFRSNVWVYRPGHWI